MWDNRHVGEGDLACGPSVGLRVWKLKRLCRTKVLAMMMATTLSLWASAATGDERADHFLNPPESARPWVYWYFQDGNLTREGMKADLESMKKAGIGGALYLETTAWGIPKGPVKFMSPAWQELIIAAIRDCERLGLEFSLGTGPGWCGAGGPWIKPDNAMQQIVGKAIEVSGPKHIHLALPQPEPCDPFFGRGTLPQRLLKEWQEYYKDVAVIAYPTPSTDYRLADADEKALYYRAPFTTGAVQAYLPPDPTVLPAGACIARNQVVELTDKLAVDGTFSWDVPPGHWTILRLGRTLTGQTTRPAPEPGLGWETGKFEQLTMDEVMKELELILNYAVCEKDCVIRSNHASNRLVLKGTLPQDRERLLWQVHRAMHDEKMLRPDKFKGF